MRRGAVLGVVGEMINLREHLVLSCTSPELEFREPCDPKAPFIHSFIQHKGLEHLLRARRYSRCRGCGSQQDAPCPQYAYIPDGRARP